MRTSTLGCSRSAACCAHAGERAGLGARARRTRLRRCGRRATASRLACPGGGPLDRRHAPPRRDGCRPRRRRPAGPAIDAPPRAGALARPAAGTTPPRSLRASRAHVLHHRLRPLPSPWHPRSRCAATRIRSLPQLTRPRRGTGGARGVGGIGGASVGHPGATAASLARPRPGACREAGARRALDRVRHVPSAGRGRQPRSHPSRAAARPPRPDGRCSVLGAARQRATAAEPARSRAIAAASPSRRTASAVRGKT